MSSRPNRRTVQDTAHRAHKLKSAYVALAVLGLLVLSPIVSAQQANTSDLDAEWHDWKEGQVPPPPAWQANDLVEIDMPAGASVRMGLDANTLAPDQNTGIVRYVVVARGLSSITASYEGVRCATGEFRVYARQVQGAAWTPSSDDAWRPIKGQSGIMVQHPGWLARNGLCDGPAMRATAADMLRIFKDGNRMLYH